MADVYVLWEWDYEDSDIIAVFASREGLQRYVREELGGGEKMEWPEKRSFFVGERCLEIRPFPIHGE